MLTIYSEHTEKVNNALPSSNSIGKESSAIYNSLEKMREQISNDLVDIAEIDWSDILLRKSGDHLSKVEI